MMAWRGSGGVGAASLIALVVAASACTSDSAAPDDSPTSSSDRADGTFATTPTIAGAPTPSTAPIAPAGQQPDGFSTIRAVITEADGEVCEVCLWLADDADERSRGLMGVTDLGDAVGMVFRFEEPTAGVFWMFQTPTPLSIAWFASDGAHVGSADMAPCVDTPAENCPMYGPGAEYDLAIEVFAGGLEPLGLGPGSRVELLEGTEADGCPATP